MLTKSFIFTCHGVQCHVAANEHANGPATLTITISPEAVNNVDFFQDLKSLNGGNHVEGWHFTSVNTSKDMIVSDLDKFLQSLAPGSQLAKLFAENTVSGQKQGKIEKQQSVA